MSNKIITMYVACPTEPCPKDWIESIQLSDNSNLDIDIFNINKVKPGYHVLVISDEIDQRDKCIKRIEQNPYFSLAEQELENQVFSLSVANCKNRKPRFISASLDLSKETQNDFLRNLLLNGKHFECSLLWQASAHSCKIPPALREQFDMIFVKDVEKKTDRIQIWKLYFGGFKNFQDFDKVVFQLSQQNQWLVLDNTIHFRRLSDRIFYYNLYF